MDETLILWALICFAIAVFLFVLEIFIPSGGILGFAAGIAMIAGIILLFKLDTTIGLIGMIISLAALPFLFAFAIKVWPDTPLGRMLILSDKGISASPGAPIDEEADGALAVGQTGTAATDLRPVGTCLIEGKRIECLSTKGVISAGTAVRIVDVDGMQTKVVADDQT